MGEHCFGDIVNELTINIDARLAPADRARQRSVEGRQTWVGEMAMDRVGECLVVLHRAYQVWVEGWR